MERSGSGRAVASACRSRCRDVVKERIRMKAAHFVYTLDVYEENKKRNGEEKKKRKRPTMGSLKLFHFRRQRRP